jgi:hypothetical protein
MDTTDDFAIHDRDETASDPRLCFVALAVCVLTWGALIALVL